MDARNLATIFAPCILRADHDKLQASLAENEQQICIIETIILEVETIFSVCSSDKNSYMRGISLDSKGSPMQNLQQITRDRAR